MNDDLLNLIKHATDTDDETFEVTKETYQVFLDVVIAEAGAVGFVLSLASPQQLALFKGYLRERAILEFLMDGASYNIQLYHDRQATKLLQTLAVTNG